MPESVTDDRKRLCRAYGAGLVFTDAFSGSDGAIVKVREMVAEHPDRYFYADQYRNPANPLAHYRTTGPELWEQTGGRITHFVAGLGTSGTIMGNAATCTSGTRRCASWRSSPRTDCTGSRG